MSTLSIVLVLILVFKYAYKYIDQLFSPKKVIHNTSTSISNDKENQASLLRHYYKVLQIDPKVHISEELINRHYYNALLMLADSNPLDSVIEEKREEIEAARSYLLDFIGYMGHRS